MIASKNPNALYFVEEYKGFTKISKIHPGAESKIEGVGWTLNTLTEFPSRVMMAKLVPSGENLRFVSVWLREALNS